MYNAYLSTKVVKSTVLAHCKRLPLNKYVCGEIYQVYYEQLYINGTT